MNTLGSLNEICPRFSMNMLCLPIDLLREALRGDIIAAVVLAIVVVVLVVVIGFCVYAIYTAADLVTGSKEVGMARVVGRYFEEAHTTMVLINNIPYYTHHDDNWSIALQVSCGTGTLSVTKRTYNSLYDGESVKVSYVIGGLSGKPHFKDFVH